MGAASARKASRAELRDAFGGDVVQLINSHADSITDLLKRLHHEIHMRVEHVQIVQAQVDAQAVMIRDLQAEVRALKGPHA